MSFFSYRMIKIEKQVAAIITAQLVVNLKADWFSCDSLHHDKHVRVQTNLFFTGYDILDRLMRTLLLATAKAESISCLDPLNVCVNSIRHKVLYSSLVVSEKFKTGNILSAFKYGIANLAYDRARSKFRSTKVNGVDAIQLDTLANAIVMGSKQTASPIAEILERRRRCD